MKQMGPEDSINKYENKGILGIQWVGNYKKFIGLAIKNGWLQIKEVEEVIVEDSGCLQHVLQKKF